jgi:SAM-dependent methyltransferase
VSGAKRIFLYNWPTYAATWAGAALALGIASHIGGVAAGGIALGAGVAAVWSAVSLAVSYWVYDRSPLAGGAWARALVPAGATAWASVDAGLDAEVALDAVMPGACVARLDVYDGEMVRARSVERARALTPRAHVAVRSRATSLDLADASCDVIAVVFTAHEIRDRAAREAFFRELRRALRDGGRLLLVEHVRDLANFCAFGPGFLHFQARAEWLRLARVTDLHIATETRVTPWVMALALEKAS